MGKEQARADFFVKQWDPTVRLLKTVRLLETLEYGLYGVFGVEAHGKCVLSRPSPNSVFLKAYSK